MASCEEEDEMLPKRVKEYYFFQDNEFYPVPYSILPRQWGNDKILNDSNIFMRAKLDSGGQTIYKKVVAWKFRLSDVGPEISVFDEDKNWIELQKPRKAYEKLIRTTLVALHWLHFLKMKPGATRDSIWNHLVKTFSHFDVQPLETDLLDHTQLISEAAERDNKLRESQSLHDFIERARTKDAFQQKSPAPKRPNFIVHPGIDGYKGFEPKLKRTNTQLCESVCAICDNGGELLCCEGKCLRSFHATIGDGTESLCKTLEYAPYKVQAMETFRCKNCKYQQHQCFICGELGSSDNSAGAEVFRCASRTCRYFYHPRCAAKLTHPNNPSHQEKIQNKVAAGKFYCPLHICSVCKGEEDENVHDLQFAMCRRCPKAYHQKCLPKEIAFVSLDSNILPRAWEGLLLNRILIYCMDHDMIKELGTPLRNHVQFPETKGETNKCHSLLPSKEKILASRGSPVSGRLARRRVMDKISEIECSNFKLSSQMTEKLFAKQDSGSTRKPSINKASFLSSNSNVISGFDVRLTTSLSKNYSVDLESCDYNSKSQEYGQAIEETSLEKGEIEKSGCSSTSVYAEMEEEILDLMEKSTSSFDNKDFVSRQAVPNSYAYCTQNVVHKIITRGKVEASVKAIRSALQKLEEGCSIEDAKAICGPEILYQIYRWKAALDIYLGPLLTGVRDTFYGPHFNNMEKLKEIVDRLQCYVQTGDMIVDFCCGSNDFSCLMKENLVKLGRRCFYKNYGLFTPKNDFCFELREWLAVKLSELPCGSRLIMGLIPPLDINMANIFISKALEFHPKILILIVPEEIQGLKQKLSAYNLIWEDTEILSGKFEEHKQLEDGNKKPVSLCLWSRPDWTVRHRKIATEEHGHVSNNRKI